LFLFIQNMMWIIFTYSTNDIIFNIFIILYFLIGVIFFLIKIGFEKKLLVKLVRLSLTILSHLTSHLIGIIFIYYYYFSNPTCWIIGGTNGELNETFGRKFIIFWRIFFWLKKWISWSLFSWDMHLRCLRWCLICDVFKLKYGYLWIKVN